MHVHMAPDDPADWPADRPPLSLEQYKKIEKELTAWNKLWSITEQNERRGKKIGIPWNPTSARYRTSSRVLVYVDGKRHGYLLLHLGFEPEGHDEATADIKLLRHWEEVAKAFIHDGSIIV